MSWKTLGVLGAIYTLTASGMAYGAFTSKPESSKLKAPKEEIVDAKEYQKDGKIEVYYSYKTNTPVDETPSVEVEEVAREKGLHVMSELKERRGENYKVFATDQEEIVYEFLPAGVQYFKDPAGDWWQVDHATSTKADYDKETKTISQRLLGAFNNTAQAQTFYPTAQEQVSRQVVAESWATIRGGAGTNVDGGAIDPYYSPFLNATAVLNTYSLHQIPVFPFDTSAIADTDVISSATFSVVVITGGKYTGNGDLNINISGGNSTAATGDYNTTISSYTTTYSTDKAISAFTANGSTYNDFALNASGIAAISKTGTTVLSMRFSIDINNSGTPTWASGGQSGIAHTTVDHAGTSADPKLVIVASPAPVRTDSGLIELQ